MTQYSKRMVIAHWLTLALVIAAWFLGDSLAEATDGHKATLAGYAVHALAGGTILLLTLLRISFRRSDGAPPQLADTPLNQTIAKAVHFALYVVLILLPITGMTIIVTGAAGKALLAGDAALLPKDYDGVFVHEVHEVLANVLIALVVLHIIGAIKHQFLMKDGLMSRMSLRK